MNKVAAARGCTHSLHCTHRTAGPKIHHNRQAKKCPRIYEEQEKQANCRRFGVGSGINKMCGRFRTTRVKRD